MLNDLYSLVYHMVKATYEIKVKQVLLATHNMFSPFLYDSKLPAFDELLLFFCMNRSFEPVNKYFLYRTSECITVRPANNFRRFEFDTLSNCHIKF